MRDFRPTLILVALAGIAVLIAIGLLGIQDKQRTAICLDHPTYYKCKDWDR
jgi:hypothetical protein